MEGGGFLTGDFFSLLAHISKDEDREVSQYLAEHLVDTALYAESRGKELGVGNICALIGLLHDAGKSLSEFQEYIQGKRDSGGDHSSYGGYCLLTIKDRLVQSAQFKDVKGLEDYCDLLTYPILAHHGLYDILDNNCYRTESRIRHVKLQLEKQVDGLNLEECLDGLNQLSKKAWGKNLSQLFLLGYNEYKVWNQRIKDIAAETSPQRKKSCTDFFMGATVRLLLSILKEADIYNSSNWNRHDVNPILKKSQVDMIWEKMHSRIEKLYEGYASHAGDSTINKVRSELANEVLQSAKRTPYGCYVLDLPVGAGKTMSSLRYAVEHARIHGNQRIFYVTAYLSVLEQNAREIQDVIGEEHVLEHHSNVVEDTQEMSEEEYSLKSYLRDSWESPVVLTTLVQFTNTLFKGKSSNLRRFCKFANSVIIIDEIQSLPIKTVYLMNLMTNFLTRFMNVTVIHCTATLPSLDNKNVLLFPCLYGTKHAEAKLVSKEWSQHSVFSRVNFHSLLGKHFSDSVDTSEILLFLRNQLSFYKSFLIILNTKSAVGTLYKALQEEYSDTADLYYLTTNLCAAHRLERIDNLKRALRALRKGQREKPLICVSTNLISVGVNVDFDVVIDSVTSIDGVMQASGRCNREGLMKNKGNLYLIRYAQESLQNLKEMEDERESASKMLRSEFNEGFASDETFDLAPYLPSYYENLYANAGVYTLSYPLELKNNHDTLVSLLGKNEYAVVGYNEVHHPERLLSAKTKNMTEFLLRQNFKTASKNYALINESGSTVIVQYKNKALIDSLYEAVEEKDFGQFKGLIKKLQRYTVNIRNKKAYQDALDEENILNEFGICILNKECYDNELGLIKANSGDEIF